MSRPTLTPGTYYLLTPIGTLHCTTQKGEQVELVKSGLFVCEVLNARGETGFIGQKDLSETKPEPLKRRA